MAANKGAYVFSIIVFILLAALIFWYVARATDARELDDVHPAIACEQNLFVKSDVLWVIPLYQNDSIANHPDWCKSILAMNKTLGMHGVFHTYKEFGTPRDTEYLEQGKAAFGQCFGFTPTLFKPPQLVISKQNEAMIKNDGMQVFAWWHQRLHKAYHCSDTGIFPNKFIDWF